MNKLALLIAATVLCLDVANCNGQDWTSLENFDFAKLEGKWIVESIEIDGEHSRGQIGQRTGDVITLSSDMNVGIPKFG